MHFSAVVHTCTDNFCYPLNDRELVINIKTGPDVVRCFVIFGDPFDGYVAKNGWKWASDRRELTEKKALAHHLWYSVTVPLDFGRCKYYFELQTIDSTAQHNEDCHAVWYYCEDGFYTAQQLEQLGGSISCFTFPCINPADLFTLPDWVSSTIWYQIFPDRFCPSEDTTWPTADHTVSNDEHYGGTLQGIISKLDYLADLGITGLYLNPVNSSPSVHKYDTSDYHTIDPAFGTTEDLKCLVQQAHHRGMKVILDGGEDPDNRRCMPWHDIESGRHDVSLKLMQQLIALRHTHPAMSANEYCCMYGIGDNESSRIIHLHKTAPRTLNTYAADRTIDIIVNADSQPVSLTALITDKATIYLSHRYRAGLLEAGGFIFYT
ncbi:MAG: alpha amylase N-terminal ig-like domain-containing protein [Treponema sp.]